MTGDDTARSSTGGPVDAGREAHVVDTILAATDTLMPGFDPLAMLTTLVERSVELLDAAAAGVVLADANAGGESNGGGPLSVAASSSEHCRLLQEFAVAIDSGPVVACVRTGRLVVVDDLTVGGRGRWPRFSAGAAEAGFRAVHAFPVRCRHQVIGVLTLLHTQAHTLREPDRRLGQALADAAALGLLHERAVRHAGAVAEQLRGALDSRVIIEQAKGALANQAGVSSGEAFTLLRRYARGQGLHLTALAHAVMDQDVDLTALDRTAATRPPQPGPPAPDDRRHGTR